MTRRALIIALPAAAAALLACTAPAAAGEPSDRHGGLISTGTVTAKAFIPQHQQWVTVGKQPYWLTLNDCWRLDLKRGPLTGWVCVDPNNWERTPVGDHWDGQP